MIKYLTISLIICIGIRLGAQAQPVPIDRIDIFENGWSIGYNMKPLDSLIVGVGTARRTGFTQGMHISSYSFAGDVLHSKFVYDSILYNSLAPNDIHDIVDLGENRFFTCTHGGGNELCYVYNAMSQSFEFVDTISSNYQESFLFIYAIKEYNNDVYVLSAAGSNQNRQIGVLKYTNDTVIYDVFGEIGPYWVNGELIVIGEDEWSVTYFNSDENKSYLFRKKNGVIEKIGIISNELWKGPIRSALIHENDEVIYVANLNKIIFGETIRSWMIVRIDSLGNTLWVQDLEGIVNIEIDPIVLSGRTQIPTIIKSVEDDGVIFVGYEYEVIDTLRTGYGLVGKVSYDGELQWLRRYRHITDDGFENKIYDVEQEVHEDYEGYLIYGTIQSPTVEPWSFSAWLMRLDKNGLPIDTTTGVIEVTTIAERVYPYPNPAGDYISFDMDDRNGNADIPIQIYMSDGQSIGERKIVNNTLAIDDLQVGQYYFKYEIEGVLYSGNFIKM